MVDTFLVTGLPGAGKTTVSRALAARFPRGVHIEADVLSFDFVVRGLPDPFGGEADRQEWHRQMQLRTRNLCMLANSFHDAGFVSVLDDFAIEVDRHVALLRRPIGLVVLAPPLDVVAARDAGRDKRVFDAWKHKDAELRASLRGTGLWVEDPDLTPGQIAELVVGAADSATVG